MRNCEGFIKNEVENLKSIDGHLVRTDKPVKKIVTNVARIDLTLLKCYRPRAFSLASRSDALRTCAR